MLFLFATCALAGAVMYCLYIVWYFKPLLSIPARKHYFFNLFGDFLEICMDYKQQGINAVGRTVNCFPKAHIVCLWISFFPLVVATRSKAVGEILKSNKILEKSFQYEWLKPLLGKGLLLGSRETWRSRRKLINPCFHSDVLRNYLETFNRMSQNLVKSWQKETKKDFTFILDPVILCAFDTVCETIFGTKIEELEEYKIQTSNFLKRVESIVMKRIVTPWYWPEFIFRHTKLAKESKMLLEMILEFPQKLIDASKKRYLSGGRLIYNEKHKALIDVLLEKHLDTKELSEEDVFEEVTTFMGAGHETIGTAIMWCIYLIGHHPEVQAKLNEEVDRIFEEDKDRAVTEEDIKELRYMDCVLKECNRIYPPVPLIGRLFAEETKICGYTVPKGTNCVISIFHLHRDKDVFPDPENFDPDRFSAENRVKIPEFAYAPFSAGPRNCIGYKFAELEVGTIMSYLLRHFTFESMNKVSPVEGIILHPSEPVRIKIRPRTMHGV